MPITLFSFNIYSSSLTIRTGEGAWTMECYNLVRTPRQEICGLQIALQLQPKPCKVCNYHFKQLTSVTKEHRRENLGR